MLGACVDAMNIINNDTTVETFINLFYIGNEKYLRANHCSNEFAKISQCIKGIERFENRTKHYLLQVGSKKPVQIFFALIVD